MAHPPNHSSSLRAKDNIKTNLAKEVAAKRMFGPFSHAEVAAHFPFFQSSPLGTAVNLDGSVRPINDLLFPHGDLTCPSVNHFVDKQDFTTTWDDFRTITRLF